MNLFSWFSSAPKAVNDILDKDKGLITQVGGWIGNMNLTPEEIMEQNGRTVDSVQTFVVNTLSENTERSKSRRSFTKRWATMHLGIILLACVSAPFDMNLAGFYLNLALSPWICSITGAISIFFYGSHGIRTYNESKKPS